MEYEIPKESALRTGGRTTHGADTGDMQGKRDRHHQRLHFEGSRPSLHLRAAIPLGKQARPVTQGEDLVQTALGIQGTQQSLLKVATYGAGDTLQPHRAT